MNWLKKLWCRLRGHAWGLTNKRIFFSDATCVLECKRCKLVRGISFFLFLVVSCVTCLASPHPYIASWYGEECQGRTMANGQPFDWHQHTCAHWNFAFGTKLRVTCKRTGRSVIVTVTDRGPAKRLHREIDLSKSAFAAIADVEEGLIEVSIDPVR